jgi:UDP:flavonoid glycosyltransferase YjiC (YdhE family)
MARILVASMPFAGHVGPMSAVAAELVRRGHEVVAYTGAKYRDRFVKAGATWLPWIKATDFDDADLAATFPEVGDGKGLRGTRANGEHVLFGTTAGQIADIMAGAPYDLLVTDQVAFGGAIAGQALGIPWATVTVTPLSLTSRHLPPLGVPWLPATNVLGRARDAAFRGLTGALYRRVSDPRLNEFRAGVGLGPVRPGQLFDGIYSTDLIIAQGVPGLEYPRPDLPAHVHYVGRLAPATPPTAAESAGLPDWWPELAAARAVVHVTQGTLDVDPADLLRPTMEGLTDRDVLVVGTTGGADPATLGPLPANARAAAFLPHDLLLPQVDAMVTNGGWGGVLAAIQAGVPLVVGGGSLDKPEVARRVGWSGAGLDLRTGTPKAGRVAAAVDRVLAEPGFRARARDLGAAVTAAGGATTAVDLVEGLLTR